MRSCGRDATLSLASVLFLFYIVGTCDGSLLHSGFYIRDKKFDDLLPTTVTQWFPSNSVVQCGSLCQDENWCNSFFYNHGSNTCALQRMVYKRLSSSQTITAPGWRYYQISSAQCPAKRDFIIDRLTVTCYQLVTSPRLSWLAARAACNSSNERLVVLEPVEKARFLHDFLNTNIALHNFTEGIYTGASRPEAEWSQPVSPSGPSFVWVNGQPLDLNTTQPFWKKNTVWDKSSWNIVALQRGQNYLWGTGNHWPERFYMCEQAFT